MAAKRKAKGPACALCGTAGIETSLPGLFEHVPNGRCNVILFYKDGVCADDRYQLEDGTIYDLQPDPDPVEQPARPSPDQTDVIDIDQSPIFTPVNVALKAIFEANKVEYLGGTSGPRGWSSISTYAKCPYLWSHTFLDKGKIETRGLGEGSLVHVFLATHYMGILQPGYPITVEYLLDALHGQGVNPEWLTEAWRIFQAYLTHYPDDVIEPLAVEHLVVDPRTGRSCRIDLIFKVTKVKGDSLLAPGTYLCDHKTLKAFYEASLEWRNDGTILTQLDLWHAMKLEKQFGKLTAAVVNVLGKQKEPKFERILVPPVPHILKDHRKHMPIWIAKMELDKVTGVFPRNRAVCTMYGKCELYDHCAGDAEI